MYLVMYRTPFGLGYTVQKFADHQRGKMKSFVQELYNKGYRDITVSKEIPIRVKVKVDIQG